MVKAKLFKNGRSQAVRLPKDFRFPGQEVYIKKIGEVVVLFSAHDPWGPLKKSLDMFTEDFMNQRHQPAVEAREEL